MELKFLSRPWRFGAALMAVLSFVCLPFMAINFGVIMEGFERILPWPTVAYWATLISVVFTPIFGVACLGASWYGRSA